MVKRKAKKKAATKKKVSATVRKKLNMNKLEITFDIETGGLNPTKRRDWKPGIYNAKIIEVKPIKRKKEIKKKQSKYWLTHRTKLTTEQMERAKIESAGGQDKKYVETTTGVFKQNLALTQAMAKAFQKAQKYVLFSDEHNRKIFIAQDKQLGLTMDLEQARIFADGFDDPDFKAAYFGGLFNLKLKFHRIHIKPDQIKLAEPQKPKSENVQGPSIANDSVIEHHNPDEDI